MITATTWKRLRSSLALAVLTYFLFVIVAFWAVVWIIRLLPWPHWA